MGKVALAQRAQQAHLCTCGIRSRCLLTLLERAEWHLSRGDGQRDRQDKTEVSGMQTASNEGSFTTHTMLVTK